MARKAGRGAVNQSTRRANLIRAGAGLRGRKLGPLAPRDQCEFLSKRLACALARTRNHRMELNEVRLCRLLIFIFILINDEHCPLKA